MNIHHFVAIDLGATSGRVILASLSNGTIDRRDNDIGKIIFTAFRSDESRIELDCFFYELADALAVIIIQKILGLLEDRRLDPQLETPLYFFSFWCGRSHKTSPFLCGTGLGAAFFLVSVSISAFTAPLLTHLPQKRHRILPKPSILKILVRTAFPAAVNQGGCRLRHRPFLLLFSAQ